MALDIGQGPGPQADSQSVGVELEPFQLVGIQVVVGYCRWGFVHQGGWPELGQHERDPPRPFAVHLLPSYEPSIPF